MQTKLTTALLLLITLSACSTISYYGQSIQGQMELLFNRENIDQMINNPDTASELKLSLQQARAIRQYASTHLSLPDNKSYLYYVDVKRPYVVWNVFAAPEFSLTANNWCYPIVGCVSYRGYFTKSDAELEAEKLRGRNLDVNVAGIAAYSTLGWFDDPLLNTMLHWKQRALAGLLFHELSHQLIYIQNETGFNEAFASSVGRLGTIQWLLDFFPEQVEDYLAYLEAQSDFRQLLLTTRNKLNILYGSVISYEKKQNKKKLIIDQMKMDYKKLKQHWPENTHFDAWFSSPINNARLTSAMTYLQDIPAFFQIFTEQDGNWPRFFARVIELETLSREQRERLIKEKSANQIDYASLTNLIKKNIRSRQIEEKVNSSSLITAPVSIWVVQEVFR